MAALASKAIDFPDLAGIPWLDRGRDTRGCDCWGLVRLAYQLGPGLALPSCADGYADAGDAAAVSALIEGGRSDWYAVPPSQARIWDLVLIHDHPWHVGVVAWPGHMLHIPEGRDSLIEPFSTGRFSRRIEGVYRHHALAHGRLA